MWFELLPKASLLKVYHTTQILSLNSVSCDSVSRPLLRTYWVPGGCSIPVHDSFFLAGALLMGSASMAHSTQQDHKFPAKETFAPWIAGWKSLSIPTLAWS